MITGISSKIYVAGHEGMLGSAIVRWLKRNGYENIITKSRKSLDLTEQSKVRDYFEMERPDCVISAAGRVGGIFANNTYRAEFIYENIMIQSNIMHSAFLTEVSKLIFIASADIYPKNCPQPAKEEYLLSGYLESTCEPFAVAKIAGIKMCESYNIQYGMDSTVIVAPNLYGPNQRYDLVNAQVLPSLIQRFYSAVKNKDDEVVLWGSGTPVRDFLFVDDVADCCLFIMNNNLSDYLYNIGTQSFCTISELAEIIKREVGFEGKIVFDRNRTDGAAKKLLDTTKINSLGWTSKTTLTDGIRLTIESYKKEQESRVIRISKIFQIGISDKDIKTLNEIRKDNIAVYKQPANYKNKVVIKPWGYEFLVFENEHIAIWHLYIRKGFSTSMHCHPAKKTSLIMLSGTAMSNTFMYRRYLEGGDSLNIDKKVFHSTKALSNNGIFLLEVESPPLKTDLVRLTDYYGRQGTGYEGVNEMESNSLEDFGYFSFEESAEQQRHVHNTKHFSVTFDTLCPKAAIASAELEKYDAIVLCRGQLKDKSGNLILDVGDVQRAETICRDGEISLTETTVMIKVLSYDNYPQPRQRTYEYNTTK